MRLAEIEHDPSLALDKRPLDKQAAELLRQRIVSGAWPPGYRLVEATLSEQMKLSRGTVRSALSELAHEGLVTQKAYTRWIVSELSADDAWELFTLRSALEALGARLAAERVDETARTRLWKAFDELESAARSGRRGRLTDADFMLHKTIIGLAGHRRLARQYRLLEQQFRVLIGSSNALLPTTGEVVAQHRPIVEAIAAGQAARAEKLAGAHNLDEGAALVAHVKQSHDRSNETPAAAPRNGTRARARSKAGTDATGS